MRIGFIGFGKWGPNIAKEISLSKNLQLAAICDANNYRLQVAEELYANDKGVLFTSDYRMLLCEQIDAIVVAVDMENSFGIAKDALLANKHLFIEKPFAMTYEHAAELQRIAIQRGLIVHVDHIMIFHSAIKKMKSKLVETNTMIVFEATRKAIGPCNSPAGLLRDLAVHDLAVLDYLLNGQELDLLNVEYHSDQVVLTLSCNSFLGRIIVGQNATSKERHTKISFSDKEIYFDELSESKTFTISAKNKNRHLSNPIYEIYDGPSALTNSLAHFMDCIQHHKQSISGPELAIRGIQIIEKAEKLMKMEMAKK